MLRLVRAGVHRVVSPAASVMLLVALAACGKATREWRPEDHDQEPSSGAAPAGSAAGADDVDAIADATWQSKCATCHGMEGHGDGPSGPMVGAADLSDPKIQDAFNDDQLVGIILNGRNRMPANPGMPPEIAAALVKKVRTFRAQ